MLTPQVTEMQLPVDPATSDPFASDSEHTSPARACAERELDRRCSDGVEVVLLWNQVDTDLTVVVHDAATGSAFEFTVEGHEAYDAFQRPYVYAARPGARSR
jgi:hypothetical protein